MFFVHATSLGKSPIFARASIPRYFTIGEKLRKNIHPSSVSLTAIREKVTLERKDVRGQFLSVLRPYTNIRGMANKVCAQRSAHRTGEATANRRANHCCAGF